MASRIGTPLAPLRVAWGWFAIGLGVTVVLTWSAAEDHISWKAPGIFSVVALYIFEPRLRKREYGTVQVDDDGVLRLEKDVREQVRWESVNEISIITTNEGPLVEDVFFVLVGAEATGCVVPHRAAVRTKLLEALQQRFPNLDDKMIITAMGCTGNNSFLIWKRPESGAPIVAGSQVNKRVLFICSRNRWCSPTAEQVFSDWKGIEVASAGIGADAVEPVTPALLEWADLIFVMEQSHRSRLSKKFRPYLKKQKIVVLGIPDEYERIHGPVGLAIGALTPGEIAISIMAQMTAVLQQAAAPPFA